MKSLKLIGIIIAVLTLIIGGFLSHKIYTIVVKKNDRHNYIYNSYPYLKLEIEKIHLEAGYIENIFGEKLNFKKKDLRKLLKYDSENYERPLGFIDFYKERLVFVSGKGEVYISTIFNKNLQDLSFSKIDTNLINNFDDNDLTYKRNFIRDILVDKNDLYIKVLGISEDGLIYTPKIIVSKINNFEKHLIFEDFFKTDEFGDDGSVDITHGGGRMVNYKDKYLLASIPDFGYRYKEAQDKKSVFGKIIKINKETKEYEVFSMGHRNPQGLHWDSETDTILSSEHGPIGGDEVNIIKKDKNYGWPIVSLGENGPDYESDDHLAYGFEEPAFYWGLKNDKQNCGPSEITKIPANFLNEKSNSYLLACLSGADRKWGLALYNFVLKNDKLNLIQKIFINDRVRDLKMFDEKILVMVLENSHSLAIIYKD
tara:strand:- start:43 stop:1320 length:1278 start_codon:yes stop_codon:yes gene_type:complete